MNFDADGELRNRLERGQSFGLSRDQYGSLALMAMAAYRWAKIEPCEIRLLPDGQPGCDVILYGHAYQFTVRMEPLKQRSTLFALPLDSQLGGPGVELHIHQFYETDYVGQILAVILRHEGAPFMSPEECDDFVREQQRANPPRPRRVWE